MTRKVLPLAIVLFAVFATWAGAAAPASAAVKVVAANQDLAWTTKVIGGNQVTVDYLAPSSQDPHKIDARPSQVLKLSSAQMMVRIGMDLDLWMDARLYLLNLAARRAPAAGQQKRNKQKRR